MIKTTQLLVIIFIASNLVSQEKNQSFYAVETDPMSTFFGAKTLSFVTEPEVFGNFSLFLNIVSADFPRWMDDLLNPKNEGKGFKSKINFGGGFAVDYFLEGTHKGYYLGIINLFFNNKFSKNDQRKTSLSHNIIPRAGYRYFLNESFYLNPFIGFRYEYILGSRKSIASKEFEATGLQPFATMHLAYRF